MLLPQQYRDQFEPARPFDTPQSIYHLLAAQAERRPNATAITAPGRAPLTYGRLLAQVQGIAKTLNTLGVGRDHRVAVVQPNGPEMAVAFLAVAAGTTVAPLNPAFTESEFSMYLSGLNADAIIVESGSDSPAIRAAQDRSIPIIELSPALQGSAGIFALKGVKSSAATQPGFAQANDVALLLHTSGTTSRPKMVPLTHSNLLASARNIATGLGLSTEDRCLNVMPLFHIHGLVGALLSSLIAGSSVICAPEFDGDNFFWWLETFDPSWYTAVPTIHQAVLSAADAKVNIFSDCSLRFIRSCSSALPPQVMRGLENVFRVPVIEAYGMTEAAHQIASNPLPPRERKAGSVGLPAGADVSIMGEGGNLLSPGEIGEIVIRGPNVMSGYANNPEANTENFASGWFRTGDQGYLDADGYVFITGRLKEMINRGGEKVSPREIDEVLLQHPAVAEAVSFAIPHVTLGEDVAAAVVLRTDAVTTETELQRFAGVRIAEFKVPRRILFVDEVPLGASGKVQRLGLAASLGLTKRDDDDGKASATYAAPRNPTEAELLRIWFEVLRVAGLGIHDNFFDLGGDSIRAAQVVSRVRNFLGVELSLVDVFQSPTVALLAMRIGSLSRQHPKRAESTISPVPRAGELPLSSAQQRLWFLDQLMPGSIEYNMSGATRLIGMLNVAALEQSLSEILRRHEILRTTFKAVDGHPFQSIAPTEPFTLPLINLEHLPKAEREAEGRRQATEEACQPFDLAQDPLFRSKLVRLGEDDHVLLLTMHHIVSDGWSMGVFKHELWTLYQAFSKGHSSPLPELPIQYADFAHWQRNFLQGDLLEKQLAYWKRKLPGRLPVMELPTDRPRPLVQGFHGAKGSTMLSDRLSEALQALAVQEGVTLFMVLLAAFNTLLHRYTGQSDIIVGADIANRSRAEIEALIGFFVNLLVIRIDLSGNPKFREFLKSVRNTTLEAYAHQDLPFEKLVEELKPDRDMSRNPLVQTLFVMQNFPQQQSTPEDLDVKRFHVDTEISRFDLALFVENVENRLVATFKYKTDLFEAKTIVQMVRRFETLLGSIVAHPDTPLSELEIVSQAEREYQAMEDRARQQSKVASLRAARRSRVDLSHLNLTKTRYLAPEETLPLVIEPESEDIEMVAWTKDSLGFIETALLKHGALLFRGFSVSTASQFEAFAQAICPELFGDYGDLPREEITEKVYESTPYPCDQMLLFHNESSHMNRWPLKQWFFCVCAAQRGGETPIVDCRKVYRLIDPQIVEKFTRAHIMYVRNFTVGLDVSWQNFFKTTDRSVVENWCKNAGIELEWTGTDSLRIRQVCPAVARHPKTGEKVWFNQLQHWHLACLDQATRQSMLSLFREEELPRTCYYGDGSIIEDSVMEHVGEVYRNTAVSFPWERGDILMIDNMLVAHARNTYEGPRKILVAMGEMVGKEILPPEA